MRLDKEARVAVVSSTEDPAGATIHRQLLRLFPFHKAGMLDGRPVFRHPSLPVLLARVRGRQVEAAHAARLPARALVFASTHSASSGEPALTAHAVGNWGPALLGGRPSTLVTSMPFFLFRVLRSLETQRRALELEGYRVRMEATHHGPYVEKPCGFVELGSGEAQWRDERAGEAVARALMEALAAPAPPSPKPAVCVGVGGNHYGHHFFKGVAAGTHAFAHVCPKYALPYLSRDTLAQALACSTEPVTRAVVDKKGLGKEKRRVLALLEETGLPVESARALGR